MNDLLNKNGKVVGLLFDFELTEKDHHLEGQFIEYIQLFYEKFEIKVL